MSLQSQTGKPKKKNYHFYYSILMRTTNHEQIVYTLCLSYLKISSVYITRDIPIRDLLQKTPGNVEGKQDEKTPGT